MQMFNAEKNGVFFLCQRFRASPKLYRSRFPDQCRYADLFMRISEQCITIKVYVITFQPLNVFQDYKAKV